MRKTKRERNKTARFVKLEYQLLNSLAWQALKPSDRAVYIELCKRYNGSNNGTLALSNRDAAKLCNIAKDTAGRCLLRLADMGFIKVRTIGGYNQKYRGNDKTQNKNLAHEYELTQYEYLSRTATREFISYRPPDKTREKTKRGHKPRTARPKPRTPKENIPSIRVVVGVV